MSSKIYLSLSAKGKRELDNINLECCEGKWMIYTCERKERKRTCLPTSYLSSIIIIFLYVMHVVKNLNEPQRRRASQVLAIHPIADIADWMAKSKSEPWKVTEQDFQWYRVEGFKTTYMNNVDLQNLNCFAINFGWSVQIDIPQVSLKSAMSKSISIPLKGSAPSLCTIVLIGKRNSLRLDKILNKMLFVSYYLTRNPVIYVLEQPKSLSVNLRYSPVMVHIWIFGCVAVPRYKWISPCYAI